MSEIADNKKQSFSSASRWITGLNAVLAVIAAFAVVVMLNYIAAGHFKRFQTASYLSTRLSPQTLNILSALTNKVEVTIFFDPAEEEEIYSLTSGLLAEYRNANPRHISVRTLDYTRFDGEAKAFLAKHNLSGFTNRNFVLFESNGRWKTYYSKMLADFDMASLLSGEKTVRRNAFRGEMLFSSAIYAISYPKQLKAYFLSGHGEHDPEVSTRADGYSRFASILKDELDCEWEKLKLHGTNTIPSDCQLLVIAGPRNASLLPTELEKIDAYLKQGRCLFVLLNTFQRDSGLDGVLSKWGIGMGDSTVLETDPNAILSSNNDFLAAPIGEHPMMRPLIAEDSLGIRFIEPRVIFPLENSAKTPDAVKVTILAKTTEHATDRKKKGAFPLLIAAEQGVIKGVSGPSGGTRILVAGDSFFLDDQLIDSAANHTFAGLALNWLLDRREIMVGDIGPRPIREYKLLITNSQFQTLQWLFLAGMPGAVLLLGSLVWLRRRN